MSTIQTLPREIQLLEQAAAFLAECQSLDEVKSLRDKAEAIRLYQKKIDKSGQATIAAGEIKVRAEIRMGELLAEMPEKRGEHKKSLLATFQPAPSLTDLGITKSESSRTQAMAALPKKEQEETIAKAKQAGRAPTSRELSVKGQAHQRATAKKADLDTKAKKGRASSNGEPATWEIREGNCIEVLETIEPHTARLIFADPPYNIGVDYGDHHDDSMSPDEYLEWSMDWMERVQSRLAADGSFWLLVNWEWAHDLAILGKRIGFHLRQTIVWYEPFGVNCTGMFNRCSRALLWFTVHPATFVFNADAPEIRRASDRQEKYNDKRANPDGKLWDDVWGVNPAIPRVVGTASERLPDFPTQLPLALLRPIVACASDPGDLVVDPFSGSGTTGAACIELGRRFIGIELSPKFAELSRLRLAGMEAHHAV